MRELTLGEFTVLADAAEGFAFDERNASGGDAAEREAVIARLQGEGLMGVDGMVRAAGLEALEPYRAKRAIMLASGFGSRMMPITINTPKPLVRVHGERIIDSLLDAVFAAGIEEVYLVRGYLAESFDQLLLKYPSIRFIDNPVYATTNNISSALEARACFQNAYVFESDLLLKNSRLIRKYHYHSNYLGVPVERTDDWCFATDEDGTIAGLKKGGEDCYHMFGISYWTAADGVRLADDLERSFADEANRQYFWDEVPLTLCCEHYQVKARACSFDDVSEIDSFAELQEIDPAYCIG